MEIEVFLLLLAVLVAGMLALKRFAEMRLRLERLVDKRTEALHDKTLQLERLAARDTLTGLYNRRHADEFLLREIARARREGHPISVALADIDHFKRINDDHSHGVGDRVLERVAQIFTQRVSGADLVARYGGEEFLFCFIGLDETDLVRRCEELRLARLGAARSRRHLPLRSQATRPQPARHRAGLARRRLLTSRGRRGAGEPRRAQRKLGLCPTGPGSRCAYQESSPGRGSRCQNFPTSSSRPVISHRSSDIGKRPSDRNWS